MEAVENDGINRSANERSEMRGDEPGSSGAMTAELVENENLSPIEVPAGSGEHSNDVEE